MRQRKKSISKQVNKLSEKMKDSACMIKPFIATIIYVPQYVLQYDSKLECSLLPEQPYSFGHEKGIKMGMRQRKKSKSKQVIKLSEKNERLGLYD